MTFQRMKYCPSIDVPKLDLLIATRGEECTIRAERDRVSMLAIDKGLNLLTSSHIP